MIVPRPFGTTRSRTPSRNVLPNPFPRSAGSSISACRYQCGAGSAANPQVESQEVWEMGWGGMAGQPVDGDGHRVVYPTGGSDTERSTDTMADRVSMALAELVRKAEAEGDVDFLREGV